MVEMVELVEGSREPGSSPCIFFSGWVACRWTKDTLLSQWPCWAEWVVPACGSDGVERVIGPGEVGNLGDVGEAGDVGEVGDASGSVSRLNAFRLTGDSTLWVTSSRNCENFNLVSIIHSRRRSASDRALAAPSDGVASCPGDGDLFVRGAVEPLPLPSSTNPSLPLCPTPTLRAFVAGLLWKPCPLLVGFLPLLSAGSSWQRRVLPSLLMVPGDKLPLSDWKSLVLLLL